MSLASTAVSTHCAGLAPAQGLYPINIVPPSIVTAQFWRAPARLFFPILRQRVLKPEVHDLGTPGQSHDAPGQVDHGSRGPAFPASDRRSAHGSACLAPQSRSKLSLVVAELEAQLSDSPVGHVTRLAHVEILDKGQCVEYSDIMHNALETAMITIELDDLDLMDLCQHLDRIKHIYDERERDERFSEDYRGTNAIRLKKVTRLLKKLDNVA